MGYNPAGNMTTTGSITHAPAAWYRRTGLDRLKQMNRFHALCEPDILPKRNGKVIQWFRYALPSANTTPHAEGTVGTSLTLSSSTISATMQEYADFYSLSSFLIDTAIDPVVDQAVDDLSYRASISDDAICRTEFDSNSSAELDTIGATFSASDVGAAVTRMKAANVRPKDDGKFVGVIHPYMVFDMQADNTAGGFIDLAKYGNNQILMSGEVGEARGCRFLESTNVKTSGTAPDVLYWNYIVGKGAVGAVDLAGSGPSKVTDPDSESFKIHVHSTPNGGPWDPEGMIGSYVAYKFREVVKTLDSTNYRYRMVKANASLV